MPDGSFAEVEHLSLLMQKCDKGFDELHVEKFERAESDVDNSEQFHRAESDLYSESSALLFHQDSDDFHRQDSDDVYSETRGSETLHRADSDGYSDSNITHFPLNRHGQKPVRKNSHDILRELFHPKRKSEDDYWVDTSMHIPLRFLMYVFLLFLFTISFTDFADDIYPSARQLLDDPISYFAQMVDRVGLDDDKSKEQTYSQIVNFTVPSYNMNVSGEWFILAMSTFEAQRYSQVNNLANSYHLSMFMQKHKIPVRAADVVWSKTIEPWSVNHKQELHHPCSTVREQNFPPSYVMKGTHCSGCVVIVNNGKLTKKDCLSKWLKTHKEATVPEVLEQFCKVYLNISYQYAFSDTEWWYRYMPRDVIVESMLRDRNGGVPSDYKIYVFAGEPVFLYITMCRECDPPINQVYHVAEGRWELTKYHYKNRQMSPEVMPMPRCWPHMVKISKMISTGIPFVRTDFYDLDFDNKPCEENVILGEMTFRPHGGNIASNYDEEFNAIMGNNAIYRYLQRYPCNHNLEFDVTRFDMVLFDLDDCIWKGDVQFTDSTDYNFYMGNETVGMNYKIELFPMVRPFMRCLKQRKPSMKLAVASHGPRPELSLNALLKFRLLDGLIDEELLVFKAALESAKDKSKVWHFHEIQKKTGIPFRRIAFFDNSHKYCVEAEQLGMKAFHIRKGFQQLWPHPDEFESVEKWDIESLIARSLLKKDTKPG